MVTIFCLFVLLKLKGHNISTSGQYYKAIYDHKLQL